MGGLNRAVLDVFRLRLLGVDGRKTAVRMRGYGGLGRMGGGRVHRWVRGVLAYALPFLFLQVC